MFGYQENEREETQTPSILSESNGMSIFVVMSYVSQLEETFPEGIFEDYLKAKKLAHKLYYENTCIPEGADVMVFCCAKNSYFEDGFFNEDLLYSARASSKGIKWNNASYLPWW